MPTRLAAILILVPVSAHTFPPYRSSGADTADPWTLEGRLGLVRVKHDAGATGFTVPLMRLNLGLPHHLELTSEFEAVPLEGRVGDAGVGLKWAPLGGRLALGAEVVLLLPVSSRGGVGVEGALLWTWHVTERLRTHLNVAGTYDARHSPAEPGWKVGYLTELRLGRFRPGFEVFARQNVGQPAQAIAGPGLIVKLGPIDVRTAVHIGLNAEAPDVSASLWVTGALPLASP